MYTFSILLLFMHAHFNLSIHRYLFVYMYALIYDYKSTIFNATLYKNIKFTSKSHWHTGICDIFFTD